jgi:hypothetical protein
MSLPEPVCVNGFKGRPTGYIKKKISMCNGGMELSTDPNATPCSSGAMSWGIFLLITLLLTGCVLFMLYMYQTGGLGRYGNISLPMDDGLRLGEPSSNLHKFTRAVINTVVHLSETSVSFAMKIWDWTRHKLGRNSGYAPVNTHYYDTDLPINSQGALELDWDDEED